MRPEHELLEHVAIEPDGRRITGWRYELDDPDVGRPTGSFSLHTDGLLVCWHASGGPAHAHSRHGAATPDEVAAWLRDRGYELS